MNNVKNKLIIVTLLFIVNLASSCSPISNNLNLSVIKKAEELPQHGILQEKKGYIYLKLDDQYIHSLYHIIQKFDNKAQKPPYFRTSDAVGAHISVMYERETENLKVEEIGKKFNFVVSKLKFVESKGKRYYVLRVESSELERLRLKYGLTKLLNGFKYHITIAVKNLE